MKRAALYSRSGRPRSRGQTPVIAPRKQEGSTDPGPPPRKPGNRPQQHTAPPVRQRNERALLLGAGALLASLAFVAASWINAPPDALSSTQLAATIQRQIDAQRVVSPAVRAHQVIAPSVVRVRGLDQENGSEQDGERSVGGTGVVIVDDGTILTNLHVVAGAERIRLVFANGFESDASIVGIRPEYDLAVLQAHQIPDDLVAATMRSTTGLALGEPVVIVGFPFGLGPSVSAGVVSGLRREFVSPEGQRVLSNLIQFDAAANPGSSGGPLVTSDGEVVGIVTGILNPRNHGVFVGIGFAVPIENAAGAAGVFLF
jgi:S1-C subfamily serine protease